MNPDRHTQFLRAFTTHEPAVRAFVRRMLPTRGDADDVLQEVAIVLWEKFDSFHADGDFRAWACSIARFKVLAWLRDHGRDRLVLDTDVVELLAAESLARESRLDRQREALQNCLAKIPDADRHLLGRAYHPAARIQEVAAGSGRSTGGFYQWLYRMRQLLLDCVTRELSAESAS